MVHADLAARDRIKTTLLSSQHVIGAIMLGLLLIVAGFFLESKLDSIDAAWRAMSSSKQDMTILAPETPVSAGMSGAIVPAEKRGMHSLTIGAVAVLLLKELGVAFLVAGIVGWAIDKQAEERDSERANDLRALIATDAVFALFGVAHEKDFIQAVVDTNLKASVVRSRMHMTYTLRTLTPEEAEIVLPGKAEDALARFVILDMDSDYVFTNVSSLNIDHDIPIAVARRKGVGARAMTRATYVSITQNKIPSDPLTAPEIDAGITCAEEDDHLSYTWQRKLKPKDEVRVVTRVMCLKELSDNEVWGSFFPTMGDVSLTLKVLPGMNCGVRPLSNGALSPEPTAPATESFTWVLQGPLLKHNSVVFWWRVFKDDAIGGVTPPNEFSAAPDPPDAPKPAEGGNSTSPPGFFAGLRERLTGT